MSLRPRKLRGLWPNSTQPARFIGVNLFSLLPSILKAVGSVLGIGVVKDAGAALAAAQISPEQQVALQEALLVHEKEMAQINLDELKTAISESVAMIQSDDV